MDIVSRSPKWLRTFSVAAAAALGAVVSRPAAAAPAPDAPAAFHKLAEPVLSEHCYECHADGTEKGGIAFDKYKSDAELVADKDLWLKVLKNVRAGVMPPAKKDRLKPGEMTALEGWVKRQAFNLDPAAPDPGRVTLRRLNRIEYRNTIRDLMGVDYRTDEEFPPDDTGYGFDTIGDVLTVSPLLLEKYMAAAETIVAQAVPTVGRVIGETVIPGVAFRGAGGNPTTGLTFYNPAAGAASFKAGQAGNYKLIVDLVVKGSFDFDPARCKFAFKADDKELFSEEYKWEDGKKFRYEFDMKWEPGEHPLAFEMAPLPPVGKKTGFAKTSADMRVVGVTIQGPLDRDHWVHPKNFERFFTKDDPRTKDGRRAYAREVLSRFATRAFRRPVDEKTVDRLVAIAEAHYSQPDKTIEQGLGQAMVAVLASPRFLFRVENVEPQAATPAASNVDEYALASRLSYFLWSTMPDDELIDLAGKGELRKNLSAQVKRLLDDSRSQALVKNFTGQWLQARDIETVPINAREVLTRDGAANTRGADMDIDLRTAMRQETEMSFSYLLRNDRSVLDLLDSDYTFLNEKLAKHYGMTDVKGTEMRRVTLPPDSPRGGLLTQGTMLAVTSNPTRTSPVKRGLFVLDNILGSPTPPPPPDVPQLEEAEKAFKDKDREPTMREVMEIHRNKPLCSSCHSRMDPLGFGLENFNAMGQWREKERGQAIESAGKLITGEGFANVRELKKILKAEHRTDFYRCLTEKLLTYALGRGLEYYDVETVDQIVARLDKNEGKISALMTGVIDSAPFQKRRNVSAPADAGKRTEKAQAQVEP